MFSEGEMFRSSLPLLRQGLVTYLSNPNAKLGKFPKHPKLFREISQINLFKNVSPSLKGHFKPFELWIETFKSASK